MGELAVGAERAAAELEEELAGGLFHFNRKMREVDYYFIKKSNGRVGRGEVSLRSGCCSQRNSSTFCVF